ncbi:hypothetical protein JKP88DRAFT_261811, partial [Tribonema minus]
MGTGAETPAASASQTPASEAMETAPPQSDAVTSTTLVAAVSTALQALRADLCAAGTEGARAAITDSELEPLAPVVSVVLSLATLIVEQFARQQAQCEDLRTQVAGMQAALEEVQAKLAGLAIKPLASGRAKVNAKAASAVQELHPLANLLSASKCELTDWFIFGSPTVLGVSGPDDMATAFIKWLHGPVAEYLVKNSEAKTLLGMVCGGKTGGALPEGVSKLKHVTLAVLSQECSRAAPGNKSSIGARIISRYQSLANDARKVV